MSEFHRYRGRWHWTGDEYSFEIERINSGLYEPVFDMPIDPDNPATRGLIEAMEIEIPPVPPSPVNMIDEIDNVIYEFFGYRDSGCLREVISVLESFGVDVFETRVPEDEETA